MRRVKLSCAVPGGENFLEWPPSGRGIIPERIAGPDDLKPWIIRSAKGGVESRAPGQDLPLIQARRNIQQHDERTQLLGEIFDQPFLITDDCFAIRGQPWIQAQPIEIEFTARLRFPA